MTHKIDFDAIEKLRIMVGMSASDMVRYLGVSRMSYYRWVNGHSPRDKVAARITVRVLALLEKYKGGWTLRGKSSESKAALIKELPSLPATEQMSGE